MQHYSTSAPVLPPQTGNPWIARIADQAGTISAYRQVELKTRQEIETLRKEGDAWRQERADLTAQSIEMGRREGLLEGRLEASERELRALKILFHQFETLDRVLKANEAGDEADKENDAPDASEADAHM